MKITPTESVYVKKFSLQFSNNISYYWNYKIFDNYGGVLGSLPYGLLRFCFWLMADDNFCAG